MAGTFANIDTEVGVVGKWGWGRGGQRGAQRGVNRFTTFMGDLWMCLRRSRSGVKTKIFKKMKILGPRRWPHEKAKQDLMQLGSVDHP